LVVLADIPQPQLLALPDTVDQRPNPILVFWLLPAHPLWTLRSLARQPV
jgi:hypothetical protein